jgi:hypothetical protein
LRCKLLCPSVGQGRGRGTWRGREGERKWGGGQHKHIVFTSSIRDTRPFHPPPSARPPVRAEDTAQAPHPPSKCPRCTSSSGMAAVSPSTLTKSPPASRACPTASTRTSATPCVSCGEGEWERGEAHTTSWAIGTAWRAGQALGARAARELPCAPTRGARRLFLFERAERAIRPLWRASPPLTSLRDRLTRAGPDPVDPIFPSTGAARAGVGSAVRPGTGACAVCVFPLIVAAARALCPAPPPPAPPVPGPIAATPPSTGRPDCPGLA